MTFVLATHNLKQVYDNAEGIIVELDYSDNKLVTYKHNDFKESLIIVDNRNLSCEIYLKHDTNPEVINYLREALPIFGFEQDKIYFL